eukprot:3863413-Amphidinium_carterae.1
MAAIIKEKPGGKVKVRLITDMLRNGTNGLIKVQERLVLPRLSDAAASIVDLLETAPDDAIRLAVVDFTDAFYTLAARENEREFLVVRGTSFWAVFRCVAFGTASGPLLWGRLAAAASRYAQAMFHGQELRLQIFVDDPFLAVVGTSEEDRARKLCLVFLLWASMGFNLAWHKAQYGKSVDWIGASLSIGAGAVSLSMLPDKVEKLQASLDALASARGLVHARL